MQTRAEWRAKLRAEMAGRQFGRLTAKYEVGLAKDGSGAVWRCQCECGTWVKVRRKQLIAGNTKSCGCLKREHDRWSGPEGFSDIIPDADGVRAEEVTSDDYPTALRLTRVLVAKFSQAIVARALKQIREERHK